MAESNVYKKLTECRFDFHNLEIKKSGKNTFAGYSYFELRDFVSPAISLFKKHGLCSVVNFGAEIATMLVVNVDDPSELIEFSCEISTVSLKGCHPIQNAGAVQTYLRRYLWIMVLEIIEHDATDASEPVEDEGPKLEEKPYYRLSAASKRKMEAAIGRGMSIDGLIEQLKDHYRLSDKEQAKVLSFLEGVNREKF